MNVFKKCFVLLELVVQLLSVVSYTVVLKQVKPLYPPVKVYRYDYRHPKIWQDSKFQYIYHKPVQSQRLYPIPVKPGRDENYKSRAFVRKEKKLSKANSSSEKPVLKDSQLLGLSQHLVPPVSNQITEYLETKEEETQEEENDIHPLVPSPHTEKSFASFGQEKGRIYNKPGDWAVPVQQMDSSNSENNTEAKFTPSQLYLQIRHKNTVIHVPQSEALKDAETLEELINAPRLKELARTTHVQETYSEEGYEDAGYDHAGHIRQAQHGEVYDAKDEGKFKIKEAPIILDYDSDSEETQKVPLKKETDLLERNTTNKLDPRITHSRSDVTKGSVEYAKIPKNYKGEHKYSSRVKKISDENNGKLNLEKFPGVEITFPSYFGEMPSTPKSTIPHDSVTFYKPNIKKSSKYRKDNINSTKIYPVSESTSSPINAYTDFNPYISVIDAQASPSTKSLKYSKIYSKKTKQLRLEPLQNENNPSPQANLEIPPHDDSRQQHTNEKPENEEPINQRIVLPTIGYINSLTTAHFGKESSKPMQSKFKPQIAGSLNLTQALNYLRTNKNQQNQEITKNPTEIDVRTFEPMKLKPMKPNFRKNKRDVYVIGEREGDDESDLPHNEKNEEIAEDERKRLEEEDQEKGKYEAELKQEISKQEKEIIKEAFKNIGIQDEVDEIYPKFSSSELGLGYSLPVETTTTPVDVRKYPFYLSKSLPENSPLRYATDPKQFPKKSGYKMEFYESREKIIQCPDFHPNLSDLPDSNSTEFDDETKENPRITELGSKIDCLKMKYFDPEPFDNPIFKEKEIDYVGKFSKRRKKVQSKIIPNISESNQRDQKFQKTYYRNFNIFKPKNNEKPNFVVNFDYSPKTNKVMISQEIKSSPRKQQNTFSTAMPEVSLKTEKAEILSGPKVFNKLTFCAPQTFLNKSNINCVSESKAKYNLKPQAHVRVNPPETRTHLIKPHNCLPNISRIAALDNAKNLTIDCNDATHIQEILNNVSHLRVIPKTKTKQEKSIRNKKIFSLQSDQSDWIPVVGYTLPQLFNSSLKPISRKTDEITKVLKESNFNVSSAHYMIDDLKEDKNVRKGEVTEDMDHYMKLIENELRETTTVKLDLKTDNSTRKKRETQNSAIKTKTPSDFAKRLEFSFDKSSVKSGHDQTQPKPFWVKRPLKRLSGLDFLVRYHKNKSKLATQKAEDFWKITTSSSVTNKKDLETKKPALRAAKIKEDKLNETSIDSNANQNSNLRKQPTALSKTKNKEINEFQKITPVILNFEKTTKKPEPKISSKTATQNIGTEKISSTRSHNFTKIITKISRETSESSEKPRIVYKLTASKFQNASADIPNTKFSSVSPKELQYKTLNRSSGFLKKNNLEQFSRSTENPVEPVLYYVVNLKTGRGKWITNYDDQNGRNLGTYQVPQKLKENADTRKQKRRKRPKA